MDNSPRPVADATLRSSPHSNRGTRRPGRGLFTRHQRPHDATDPENALRAGGLAETLAGAALWIVVAFLRLTTRRIDL